MPHQTVAAPRRSTLREDIDGSRATVREIIQQPDVWREAFDNVESRRAALDAFVGPLLARPDLRIVLTGAGTSAFAGDIAAPALMRALHRRVDAIATTDIVSNPREHFAEDLPTLLVSFARSGNSPESLAATHLADECLNDVSHLVLTCDEQGRLYTEHSTRENSLALLMPERANDRGFAMTSSFTSMLLSCLLILRPAPAADVEALTTAATHIIESRFEQIAALAEAGHKRIVYLGAGALSGLARESALKLLELTAGQVVTYFDSALGFRHGPKAVLNDETLVIVFVSSDPYTREYDLDIADELRSSIGVDNVVVVAAGVRQEGGANWFLEGLEGLDDAFLAVAYAVVAQLVGLSFSLELGMTPDNPFPGNEVNRVVQGVIIHPLFSASDRAPKTGATS